MQSISPKPQAINPLDAKVDVNLKPFVEIYSPEDKDYLSFLQYRLEVAKRQKDQPYPEFNGKTYYQIYEENEKIANTNLEPKKNDDDVIVSAGTIESKLDALLANINNLDLSPNVLAYDSENNLISELGLAMQDTMAMIEENDGGDEGGDEEKKMMRQRELLKQGTVFVQEEWLRLFETKKTLNKKYDGKFSEFGKDWKVDTELVYSGPGRTLLYGPNVYMGNMFEFFTDKQPYIFAVINQDYDIAKSKYQSFENWKYVKKGAVPVNDVNQPRTIFDNYWRLTDVKDNQVEIILYQDQPRDEFQIIINGVAILPIGFPLSAVSPGGKYNITKQVFRINNNKFAYGKSFVSSGAIKEVSALIDEMLKLFVLKTRKSFTPAYINTSGRVISKKVLSPGRISMGIPPDALVAIGQEGQGVTSNEFNVLKELQDRIDKSTVSNIFQGQQGKAGTTATEVVELQRQAKLTLGLTIAVVSLLEKKLNYLRLWNVIENWFSPIDTKIDSVRGEINKYRNTTREVNIEGEGMGQRTVIPTTDSLPNPKEIRAMELQEEELMGYPIRKIYLDPEALKYAKLRWFITITPREKESSSLHKLLFREMLADVLSLIQLGSQPSVSALEDELSRVWGKSKSKLFQNGGPGVAGQLGGGASSGALPGRPNASGAPKIPIGAGV